MTDTTCAAEAAVHRAAALAGQWLQAAGRTQDRATAERLRAYGTALRDSLLGHPAEAPDCACHDEIRKARREAAEEAWDEGYDAGHAAARAVNPEWPRAPRNPYRKEDPGVGADTAALVYAHRTRTRDARRLAR